MNDHVQTYQQLEAAVVAWLPSQSNVRAALLVGSRARIDPPADQWSDLDFIFFVTEAAIYTANADWLAHFGSIEFAELEHSSRGDAEWIALYTDGRKIDILIAACSPAQPIDLLPYEIVVQHGARVVLDRDGQLQAALDRVPALTFRPPTAEEFAHITQQAWLIALRAAKFAWRGDLWRAKQSCDCELKQSLLTLLEWHAHIVNDSSVDTWHDGRYLEEWTDREVVKTLSTIFANYDQASIQLAVLTTLDLIHRLAVDIAGHLRFDYPRRNCGASRRVDQIHSIVRGGFYG